MTPLSPIYYFLLLVLSSLTDSVRRLNYLCFARLDKTETQNHGKCFFLRFLQTTPRFVSCVSDRRIFRSSISERKLASPWAARK